MQSTVIFIIDFIILWLVIEFTRMARNLIHQAAFYSILITHLIGIVRLILEVIYPVPACGVPDTRPLFLSKMHSFYYSEMMMVIQTVLIIVISFCSSPRTKEEVGHNCLPSFKTIDKQSF